MTITLRGNRAGPNCFWESVDRSGGPKACWPWIGSGRAVRGYCYRRIEPKRDSKRTGVHRMAYALHHGILVQSIKLQILHRCDNPPCCNPAHLFVGNTKDNMVDCVSKGRMHPGEKHGNSRYTDNQIREFLLELAEGKSLLSNVARKHGIEEHQAWWIAKRRSWKHVLPNLDLTNMKIRNHDRKVGSL